MKTRNDAGLVKCVRCSFLKFKATWLTVLIRVNWFLLIKRLQYFCRSYHSIQDWRQSRCPRNLCGRLQSRSEIEISQSLSEIKTECASRSKMASKSWNSLASERYSRGIIKPTGQIQQNDQYAFSYVKRNKTVEIFKLAHRLCLPISRRALKGQFSHLSEMFSSLKTSNNWNRKRLRADDKWVSSRRYPSAEFIEGILLGPCRLVCLVERLCKYIII